MGENWKGSRLGRVVVAGCLLALPVFGQQSGVEEAKPTAPAKSILTDSSNDAGGQNTNNGTLSITVKASGQADTDQRTWVEAVQLNQENHDLMQCAKLLKSALEPAKGRPATEKGDSANPCSAGTKVDVLGQIVGKTVGTIKPDRDYVVQIVEYVSSTDKELPAQRQIRSNAFYRWREGMKSVSELTKPRIYGNPRVTTILIALNVRNVASVTIDASAEPLKGELDALYTKRKVESESALALADAGNSIKEGTRNLLAEWQLISGYANDPEKAGDPTDKCLFRVAPILSADGTIPQEPLQYTMEFTNCAFVTPRDAQDRQYLSVTKRVPANWTNLLGILQMAGLVGQAAPAGFKANPGTTALYGVTHYDDVPVPSDMDFVLGEPEVASKTERVVPRVSFKQLGSEFKVLNEGRYFWDVSVGLPVKNIRELEYTQTGGTIQSREISLPNLYAFANVFLPFDKAGVDLEDSQSYWKPRLLFGVGIKGKPFDRLFSGVGMGLGVPGIGKRWKFLNEVQVFAGLAHTRFTEKPADGNPDQLLPSRWSHRFTFGLNIPVKSATQRLASKKK